ncbi:MAG: hypothetical protein CME66_03600 [Halobacteriovoraceae bacterium]|mgnify:CR=1 FL=1|nr:hypothetical protein [Halobacteriovoraceae bacterium]
MNLNLDFISEKFGDGKVAELNLSPKMGTMVKNIQKPLAFIQKKETMALILSFMIVKLKRLEMFFVIQDLLARSYGKPFVIFT